MDVALLKNFKARLIVIGGSLATIVGVALLNGCQTAPVTGRRQLLTVSASEENKLGLTAYQKVLQEEHPVDNEAVQALVKRVGQRIAAVADQPDFQWEFNAIESNTKNAFCLPGGKVAIYSGILPVCQSEAGLAVVMSHEIAHAIARHGGERMSHQMVQNGVKQGIAKLTSNESETTQKIVLTAYGMGSQYGAILPYSRKHELEADHIGIMLMAKAGYDPTEAPKFWERFSAEGGQTPIEFLSTHPSDARRSATLRDMLPEAMELYRQAPEKIGRGIPMEDVMPLGI